MQPPSILIVDDEPYIRTLLEQTLEDLEGAAMIYTAVDGRDGLQQARVLKPRVMFLDIMMPHLDGFEVCRLLREDPALNETVVVLLTARGQEVDRQKGLEVGANLYITKPFDPDAVLSLARQVLEEGIA
ncbi:MAG: response regulator [Alphaproteobacteria bacterium]|jgi:two-component system alkaline phosphatase synthesis response regulator PhoP|nr:response regulator [Alphaproteobacteria bacterium]